MQNIPSELRNMYINGGTFQFNTKVQVLDSQYNIVTEINEDILDGQITVDRGRTSVRSLELRLVNKTGRYTWNPNSLIFLDKKYKVFFGVYVNGSWTWLPQGIFVCSPSALSKPGVAEVTLRGSDKMSALGKTENNITVQGGIANPSGALILSNSGSGSPLTSTTYYVRHDFTNSQGRTTTGSSQASIAVTAGQNITTTIILPSTATGTGIYVGTASNPKLLGTISSGGTITYSGGLSSGLSVVVTGNQLSVTISAPSSGTGANAQITNTAIGTDIATAIKSVLNGIETMFNLDDTSSQTPIPYDMTWQAGTEYGKIISDLAGILVWEIYYDVNGYLRLRPPIDPNTTNPQFTLSSNTAAFNLWSGSERQLDDSEFANSITVYGSSSQSGIVSYTLQDNDPLSPTSIQRLGKKIYLHNNGNPDPSIFSAELAQYRAEYEYKKRVRLVEVQNYEMFVCPFVEHDDVYDITDEANGTVGKYQVVSFTLPLGASNQMMSGTMWKNRGFSF